MCVRCGTGTIAWCTDPFRHELDKQQPEMSPHNALRKIEAEITKYPSLRDQLKPSLDVLWDYVIKGGK